MYPPSSMLAYGLVVWVVETDLVISENMQFEDGFVSEYCGLCVVMDGKVSSLPPHI